MNPCRRFLLLFLLLLLPLTFTAQANEPVGEPAAKVLLSIGKNQAVAPSGEMRVLKRLSELYPGDRIETGPRGRVQLRFSDGSLLSLKADTQFAIDQYRFDEAAPTEGKAVYQLLKGGMRTVTGLIGAQEKEDYQLETPVATIGIRGTHFSLHLCDAGCSARTGESEGLFGGVTQGGIELSNESGRHAMGVDDFFYLPNRQAAPEALLAPPELLVEEEGAGADSEETGDDTQSDADTGNEEDATDGEEQAETTDTGIEGESDGTGLASDDDTGTDGESDGSGLVGDSDGDGATLANFGDGDGDSDTDTSLSAPLVDTTGTDSTPPASDPETSTTETTTTVTDDTTTPDDTTTITEPVTNLTGAVEAPAGAVLGVSFIEKDTLEGFRSDGHSLIQGNNASLQINEIEGTANIPVYLSVTDTQTRFTDPESCTPCVFSAEHATLADTGGLTDAGAAINWGRWTLGWTLTENGVTFEHQENMHFIYSPDRSSETLVRSRTGALTYGFAGGTAPTDEQDQAGSYLAGNQIRLDFSNQMLLGFDLKVEVGGKQVDARQLHSLVPFDVFLGGGDVLLTGLCTGGNCASTGARLKGDARLHFIGSGAERILVSWGLFEDAPDLNATLAFSGVAAYAEGGALPTSTFSFAPPGSALLLSHIRSDGPGLHEGQGFNLNADVDTAIVVDTVGSAANTPIYTHFETVSATGEPTCPNCEISAGTATLVDSGGLPGVNQGLNWGRWAGAWSGTSDDPSAIQPRGDLHFIYSPNTTPDSVVRSLTGSFTYNYAGGTAPTDESGTTGTLHTGSWIGVDFNTQSLTSVTLAMEVNGRTVTMNEQGPVAIDTLLANQPVPLSGSCSGGACGTTTGMVGEMGVDFVGPGAERLMTQFNLNDDSASPTLGVSGTAAYQR